MADAVCGTLEANGIRCWIAPRDVIPGQAYGEAIIDAIHGCRIMVLIFSSHANASGHIPKEIERAVSKGVTIMPFRIEGVTPGKSLDYFIGSVHWLDALTPPLESHLQKLASNVQTLLSRGAPEGERKPEERPRPPVAPAVAPARTPAAPAAPAGRPVWIYAALGVMAVAIAALAGVLVLRKPATPAQPTPAPAAATATPAPSNAIPPPQTAKLEPKPSVPTPTPTPEPTPAKPAAVTPSPAPGTKPAATTPPPAAPRQISPSPATSTKIPGTVRVNPKDGLKYVWIPPGSFQMGCSQGDSECYDNEKPAHQVTITRGFWMGQTEVTVAAYKRFAAATGQQMAPAADFNTNWVNENMPIVNVTWKESQAYCQWSGGRLPTEAEWEYAARSGSREARYGPLGDVAWYADNSGRQHLDSAAIRRDDQANYGKRLVENGNGTHEVAQKRANGFGLYDTLGNVWEWVNDWYDGNYYQSSPSQDPSGPGSGQYRVLRGGSWSNYPRVVRVSVRNVFDPAGRNNSFGLRCVGEANSP